MRGGPPGQRFPHKEPQLDTPEALEAICTFRFNTDSWHTSFSFQEPLFIISPIFPSLRPAVLISLGLKVAALALLESHQGIHGFVQSCFCRVTDLYSVRYRGLLCDMVRSLYSDWFNGFGVCYSHLYLQQDQSGTSLSMMS